MKETYLTLELIVIFLWVKKYGPMLRSCLEVDWSWIGDVGDDQCCQWWLAMDGVQMDFGFSFDAAPTIDMVLYFRR